MRSLFFQFFFIRDRIIEGSLLPFGTGHQCANSVGKAIASALVKFVDMYAYSQSLYSVIKA